LYALLDVYNYIFTYFWAFVNDINDFFKKIKLLRRSLLWEITLNKMAIVEKLVIGKIFLLGTNFPGEKS